MILTPGAEAYRRAAQVLREGGVVAHPTETVYGLAVDPLNIDALAALFCVKGRPETNPVLLIVSDVAQVERYAAEIPDAAYHLMERFWPGPLSLVLPARTGLPEALTAGSGGVCIRCTGSEIARGICAAFGGAVTSTSANRSGEPPAVEVEVAVLPGVAMGIDGGELGAALPSTIYDACSGKVLRAGGITQAEIWAALSMGDDR